MPTSQKIVFCNKMIERKFCQRPFPHCLFLNKVTYATFWLALDLCDCGHHKETDKSQTHRRQINNDSRLTIIASELFSCWNQGHPKAENRHFRLFSTQNRKIQASLNMIAHLTELARGGREVSTSKTSNYGGCAGRASDNFRPISLKPEQLVMKVARWKWHAEIK